MIEKLRNKRILSKYLEIKGLALVPINISDVHWALLVVEEGDNIFWIDSLLGPVPDQVKYLAQWVRDSSTKSFYFLRANI